VADRDLGQGSRLAAATGAYVCFEDEAGQSLRPPKARTWARRGHTPVITVSVVRNRLKRIQYRPALVDGFLAQTGLTLGPGPP